MKVSDYIVEFMVRRGVRDFFGYQGTMIAHLVDSVARHPLARNHSSYHEQGASFAACGYAQARGECAFAYATSGPGAVNLLSGVADAFFDSLPVIFVTGQLNTYEYSGIRGLRQQGFQEIDIVSMAAPVTKRAVQIRTAADIVRELPLAYALACHGRRGPVLLDIPMDIQRGEIEEPVYDREFSEEELRVLEGLPDENELPERICTDPEAAACCIKDALSASRRPVLLLGNGVRGKNCARMLELARSRQIPVITSVLARDILDFRDSLFFGCIGGAYGHRYANMIASAKSDLLICMGISMCTRQIGTKVHDFAQGARLIRVDIDPFNLQRVIHTDPDMEQCFMADAGEVARLLLREGFLPAPDSHAGDWLQVCTRIRRELERVDETVPEREPNEVIARIGEALQGFGAVAADVGQHMVWTYQSLDVREGTRLLFSGGHGAMGYGLPAAIGACLATGQKTACICGDGAFQMNIQELEWIRRDRLPVKMIVMNNHSLGMIRHLQRDYFNNNYEGTSPEGGFTSGSFSAIADAYGIPGMRERAEDLLDRDGAALRSVKAFLMAEGPGLLEIVMEPGTYAYPKTCLGEPIYRQQPYAPEDVFEELMRL